MKTSSEASKRKSKYLLTKDDRPLSAGSSIFSRILSRLSHNASDKSNVTVKCKYKYRSRETGTIPIQTESKATQTSLEVQPIERFGRRSLRHCKSFNCKKTYGSSKSCSRNSCCSSENQWCNFQTTPNCTEYCTIIPAYIYSPPPIDLNCEKCFKSLPYLD